MAVAAVLHVEALLRLPEPCAGTAAASSMEGRASRGRARAWRALLRPRGRGPGSAWCGLHGSDGQDLGRAIRRHLGAEGRRGQLWRRARTRLLAKDHLVKITALYVEAARCPGSALHGADDLGPHGAQGGLKRARHVVNVRARGVQSARHGAFLPGILLLLLRDVDVGRGRLVHGCGGGGRSTCCRGSSSSGHGRHLWRRLQRHALKQRWRWDQFEALARQAEAECRVRRGRRRRRRRPHSHWRRLWDASLIV
mmetsp:Transcript_67338/g.208260  ORF Transcript_67338/g.208260 Transcript_67338/m.208260 type:complete len:253 (+) Transcript_67338:341-1099(+)